MTPSELVSEEKFFTKDVEAERLIKDRGYRLLKFLGEGGTRRAYLSEYSKDGIRRLVVVKIPLEELAENNATAQIFQGRYPDLEESELEASNRITSEHVTQTYEAIPYNGRSITVEEYFPNATSLEDRLEHTWSRPNEDGIRHIAIQLVNALEDVHQSGLIHKDVKPANILVGSRGLTKLTDLQTTRSYEVPTLLPTITKGGTKYTHPDILNAILDGYPIDPDPVHDIYSLGATLYKSLTGEDLIDLSLVPDKEGTVIKILDRNGRPVDPEGKEFRASLLLDGKKDKMLQKGIQKDIHDRLIRKRLKKAPAKWRRLLEHCLIDDPKNGNYYVHQKMNSYDSLRNDLENTKSKLSAVKPALRSAGRFSGWALTGSILLGGLLTGANWMAKSNEYYERQGPPISKILMMSEFGFGKENTLTPEEIEKNNIALTSLKYQFKDLESKLNETNKKYVDLVGDDGRFIGPANALEATNNVINFDKRISYSVLRSTLMQNPDEIKSAYEEKRHIPGLTPKEFSKRLIDTTISRSTDNFSEMQDVGFMQRYLRHLLAVESKLPNVMATYYSSFDDVSKAKQTSGTDSYFPTIQNGKLVPGYRRNLPKIARELTDRALALHAITDYKGNVNFDYLKNDVMPRINSVALPSTDQSTD